jgi:tight adherence protein C
MLTFPVAIPLPLLISGVAFLAIVYIALLFTDDHREQLRATVHTYSGNLYRPPLGRAVQVGTFDQRVLGPIFGVFARVLSSTAPDQMRAQALHKLTMAGNPVSVSTFLALRGAVFFGLPIAYAGYTSLSGSLWGPKQLLILGFTIILGRIGPMLILNMQIRARQKKIERSIPDAVDLIVACVEGGLSLDGAMMKVTERMKGPLSDETSRALHEISLGRPRRDAIKDMAIRTGVQPMQSFSQSITQADQMGIAIADVLRTLGEQLRERRRLKAQEMAQKAPVKMIPIVILFIMPAVMAVAIAPAIITLTTFLKGG